MSNCAFVTTSARRSCSLLTPSSSKPLICFSSSETWLRSSSRQSYRGTIPSTSHHDHAQVTAKFTATYE